MKKEYRCTLKTKKQIRTAFAELLGEKKNIEEISVRELSERAEIAKSTFYNHYDDIYAVAEEFEDELIEKLSEVFLEIESSRATEYENYIHRVILFLESNDTIYRKAIQSGDVRFFLEKLKNMIAKKIFERPLNIPFSEEKNERYVQIRFLTNASVDIIVDYFKGRFNLPLCDVEKILIAMLNKYKS